MSFIKKILAKGMREVTQVIEGEVTRRISMEIHKTQRRVVKSIIGLLIIILGIIFLASAGAYLFIEYLAFSKTISFLIVGIFLLLIGVIIKLID